MYRLLFDDYVIYDPRVPDLTIREPNTHMAVNEPGSMTFTLDYDHPNIQHLTKMKGTLELQEDGVPIYRGRVTKDTKDFDNARRIETEGVLAYLNDSVVPPFDFPVDRLEDPEYQEAAEDGNVVEYFLSRLIDSHNDQVTDEQKITLGSVTVTDPNNYVSRSSSDYGSTWSVIQDKIVNSSLGGYLMIRYEADGNYLDYLSDFPLTNVQNVEFAENLLDLISESSAAGTFSAILPIGADGLTIEEIADGPLDADRVKEGKLIYSLAGIEQYGRITRVEKWDDVTLPENLLSKASAFLGASSLARTITVSACDLHAEDGATPSFRVGRYTRLTSTPHDFAALYPLMQMDLDITDPGETTITLGETIQTQTDINKARMAALDDRTDQQQIELDQQAKDIESLTQGVSEQITEAIQSSQEIIFRALENYVESGDLETYKQEVSTQFRLTADQIQLSFRTATEQIASVNGELQSIYAERLKYIRFENGDIVLGENGNKITLRIANDRISFLDAGAEVAYISDRRLYITDAHFLVSLRIGQFEFVPRENGNLSFRKVATS